MANYGENNEITHISTLPADRPLFENTNLVDREKKTERDKCIMRETNQREKNNFMSTKCLFIAKWIWIRASDIWKKKGYWM